LPIRRTSCVTDVYRKKVSHRAETIVTRENTIIAAVACMSKGVSLPKMPLSPHREPRIRK